MNSAISIFDNATFGSVRVIQREDELWFVAADVCAALELGNVSQAVSSLDDDEKTNVEANIINDDVQGGRSPLIISEPGLYSLILRSRKPEAKAFKRWITHEVIPAIRKSGGYMVAHADETPEAIMARAVLVAQDTIERMKGQVAALEQKVIEDRPKVLFAEAVSVSDTTILIRELAKLLNQNGIDIGERRLFGWLRENGYLIKSGSDKNSPTQRSMDLGLFVIREGTYQHPDKGPQKQVPGGEGYAPSSECLIDRNSWSNYIERKRAERGCTRPALRRSPCLLQVSRPGMEATPTGATLFHLATDKDHNHSGHNGGNDVKQELLQGITSLS